MSLFHCIKCALVTLAVGGVLTGSAICLMGSMIGALPIWCLVPGALGAVAFFTFWFYINHNVEDSA